MAKWINRTVVQAPRNGTTSHTVAFTPAAAGSLLVLVLEGAVTHTVPTGWTRRAQALNVTELSVYTKTATAGESSFSTTHNGSNYPIIASVYEFASGSTWVNGVSAVALGAGGTTNPNLTGLTGTNLVMAASAAAKSDGFSGSAVWSGATNLVEDVDASVTITGFTTDGYSYSLAYVEDYTAASFSPTFTGTNWDNPREALTFAVKAAAGSAPKQGYVTGTWTSTGVAVGKRTPKAAATGTWDSTGTAISKRTPKATAAGAATWSGTATGRRVARATAAGAATWSGTATGLRPPALTVIASGTWTTSGHVVGRRTPKASSSVQWGFVGLAMSRSERRASVTSQFSWLGSVGLTNNIELPSSISFGKVVGRVIHLVLDTPDDLDDKPEARPAAGKVTFTPVTVMTRVVSPDYNAIVLNTRAACLLSSRGYVLDAEGRNGVWLAWGRYLVTFDIVGRYRSIPDFYIEVGPEHTAEAPLDLAREVPFGGGSVVPVLNLDGTWEMVYNPLGNRGALLTEHADGTFELSSPSVTDFGDGSFSVS